MITTEVVRMLNATYKVKPILRSKHIYSFAEAIGVVKIVPENSNNGIPTYYWTAENVKDLIVILKNKEII